MHEIMTKESFDELLNTKFTVMLDASNGLELELVSTKDLGSTPAQIQFSILFRGSADLNIGQGTHRVAHERLGEFDLFLVPVAKKDDGFYYEAVFNRLTQKD